ncbi:hypothetical protein PDJ95_29645 [Bacillus cereus]|nr:hypothetical protein [Bacillus cereus]
MVDRKIILDAYKKRPAAVISVLVQIRDTFQKPMRIPTGIVLYAVNPNN